MAIRRGDRLSYTFLRNYNTHEADKVYLRNGVTEPGIYLRGSARSKRRRDAC